MLPLDVKHRWMFVAILFFGILDKNSICDSSDADDKCTQKNVLFVNAKKNIHATFPSKSAYYEVKENKLYFKGTQCTGSKICRFEMMGQENDYSLITNEATLSKHDIVLMNVPDTDFECMLSEPSSTDPGFLLKIRNCSKTDYKSIRLSQNGICGKNSHYNEAACGDLVGQIKIYKFIYNDTTSHCLLCERPETTTPEPTTSTTTTPEPPTSTTTTSTTTTPEPPTSTTTTPEPPTSVTTTPEPPTSTTTTSTTTTPEPPTSTTTTPEPPTSVTTTPEPTTSTTTTSTTTTPEPPTSTTTTSTTTTPEPPTPVAITVIPPEGNNGTGISPENAANIMENLSYLLEEIGNSNTATVTIGHIKGGITKLLPKASNINFGITASDDVNIFENIDHPVTSFSRLVQIPTEAIAMALKRNSSFAGVLLFPGMYQDDPNSYFLNNELLGIDMGTEISNLSQTIDIHYTSVDKNGSIASCQSWDGKGKSTIWITDGCQTKETSNSITCQCSHLTFFAILLSPPPVNISASDFTSLSYITSVGCGLSMFFLMVALFMHFLIRKGKASQATKILMNLFAAMLTLNLSFLVNESIAELGNFGACMAVAAVMHYTMLATCTWFFIEALHLYFNLWKPNTGKHYMAKICAAGWVTPAVVVIPLLALRQYDYLVIYTDDGNSAKMCWISDAVVHQGVNVGYYAVVFIFTFVVFFMTVRQIVLLKPTAGKSQQNSYTKTNSFSIFGLFVLLGITWGFAFFSHGPLLIASYYLFTILNSFQGFFLFIYYVNSSKNRSPTDGISSTATSDTVTSPQ